MACSSNMEVRGKFPSEEYLCPICLEEFCEPKILPCLHNLCLKCVEDLAKSGTENRPHRCPLCRSNFRLPNGGPKNLPTNTKLVKLLKDSPSQSAKAEITIAIEDCKTRLETIKDVSQKITKALIHEGNKIKQVIHETAENIIEVIRNQEKQLFQEVDDLIEREASSHPTKVLIRRTQTLVNNVEDVIKQNDLSILLNDKKSFLNHLNEATTATTKLQQVYQGLDLRTSTLNFRKNRDFTQCLSGSLFGNIHCRRKTKGPKMQGVERGLSAGLDIIKPGTRFRSLGVPEAMQKKFHPFAIASNTQGNIAVSDQGSHSVLLYKENGEFLTQVGIIRGSNDGELECPTGVSFLSPHIMTVSDGCLFGNPSRLQAFDTSGRFVRCLAKLTKNTHWFTHVSTLKSQQIVITCRNVAPDYESYVQVFNTDGTVSLAFGATGEGKLIDPSKTVYLNDQFYVSDCDKSSNCCMIKVFDNRGRYVRSFGESMLKSDGEDHRCFPLVIEADPHSGTILAYSGLFRVVRCYKQDGSLVSYYGTISGITDMALTSDRRLFAICDGSGEFPHSVQIIFHI